MSEQQAISVSQLAIYNPQRISDEVMMQVFITRKKIFQLLMKKIKQEQPNSIPQHHLIIALRGMGKSTLLKRIEIELRQDDRGKKEFIPLLYPEEQYNLSNLSEFWLNSLDSLADTLEIENNVEIVKEIDNYIDELKSIHNLNSLARGVYYFFRKITSKIGRRPVLLIDNLNLVFERLSKQEQHQLRAWLMQNNAPILLGASSVSIKDTHNYGMPFYDAFQIHYLKKLSFDESLSIINELTRLTKTEKVLPSINNEIGRLKTIYNLTGGNTRTSILLFRLLIKGFSNELNDDLEALLDEITPLYKARFESLSDTQQKIIDSIALNWDPINLEDLRKATRLSNNQISPQLNRLKKVGWIETLDAYKTKGKAYQISERFFNIWFLMRRSSRRQKRELLLLSKFLESFYGEHLLGIAINQLEAKVTKMNQVTINLAMAEVVENHSIKQQLRAKSYNDLKFLTKENPNVKNQFDLTNRQKEFYDKWINNYFKAIENEDYIKGKNTLENILKLKEHAIFYHELGDLLHYNLEKFIDAEKYYLKATTLDNNFAPSWNNLGHLYQDHLELFENAENAFLKAIKIDSSNPSYWNDLASLYQDRFKENKKAEKAFLKSINLDNNNLYAWYCLAYLYKETSQYIKAEKAFLKVIKIDNNNSAHNWNNLGKFYLEKTKEYKKAEEAFLMSISLNNNLAYPWYHLGYLYMDHLNEFNKSESAFRNALEINQEYFFAASWNGLGNLYFKYNYINDAKEAYLEAIELDEEFSSPWYNLGRLYHYTLSEYKLAQKAYLNAIELNKNYAPAWYSLGNLYFNHLQNYKEAELAYLKSISIDKNFSYPWIGLGNLYLDYLQKYDSAESAFLMALKLDKNSFFPINNLVFLYRDKMNLIEKSKKVFDQIKEVKWGKDSYQLNKVLFSLYERNEGIAHTELVKSLSFIKNALPPNTQDDWMRFAAVTNKLGYNQWLQNILKDQGYDIILAPYFVAIKALNEKDEEGYLNSKAVEIREPAKKIIEMIRRYMD